MRSQRVYLLLWGLAISIVAYVVLDLWSARNAPLYKKFERRWSEDVRLLEESKRLPPGWFDVREIELIGGNAETKAWLRKIEVPIKVQRKDGHHKLEALIVVWEADGKRGVMIQYNLVDLKTNNMTAELARTIMLAEPGPAEPLKSMLEDLWP